ncbi:MAG: DUF5372 family protein [Janthinobacterium lividum]
MRITHPSYPMVGHKFELVCRRLHWGGSRVVYVGSDGALRSISSSLTDIDLLGPVTS